MATSVGNLVVNFMADTSRYTTNVEKMRKLNKDASRKMITDMSNALSAKQQVDLAASRKMIEGMTKAANATKVATEKAREAGMMMGLLGTESSRASRKIIEGMTKAQRATMALANATKAAANEVNKVSNMMGLLGSESSRASRKMIEGMTKAANATIARANATRVATEEAAKAGAMMALLGTESSRASRKIIEGMTNAQRAAMALANATRAAANDAKGVGAMMALLGSESSRASKKMIDGMTKSGRAARTLANETKVATEKAVKAGMMMARLGTESSRASKKIIEGMSKAQRAAWKFANETKAAANEVKKVSNMMSLLGTESSRASRKMIDGMSKSGRAARTLADSVGSAGNTTRSFNTKSAKGTRALLELSRGAEDAAVSFGIGGLSGAIRGSLNNLTQFAFIAGGPAWGAVAGFVAAGVAMIPVFWKLTKGAKDATAETDRLERSVKRLNDTLSKAADRAGALAGLRFDLAQETTWKGKSQILKDDLFRRKREKATGTASRDVSIKGLKSRVSTTERGVFGTQWERRSGTVQTREEARKRISELKDASAKRYKGATVGSDADAMQSLRISDAAQVRDLNLLIEEADKKTKEFEDKITALVEEKNQLGTNVRDAQNRIDEHGRAPAGAVKPDPEAIKALDKLALSFKSPFDRAVAQLEKTKDMIRQLGTAAGWSKKKMDALIASAQKQFDKKYAKFLQPAAAGKPPKFSKEELSATKRIKQAIKTPQEKMAEKIAQARKLPKGLLSDVQLKKYEALLKSGQGGKGSQAAKRAGGAVLGGSAESNKAVLRAMGAAQDKNTPAQKTQTNTQKTAANTKQTAAQMLLLNKALKGGKVILSVKSLTGP